MRSSFLLPALLLVAACGGGNVASNLVRPPEYPTQKEAKCGVVKSQSEPLVVEWPDAARGKLESVSRQGLVAVRYQGCELQVLRCRGRAQYQYSPLTRKQNRLSINNNDELYANLPVGAFSLEGKLKTAGQLNVQMTLVGRFELRTQIVSRAELEGDDCAAATHVISALSVGAFTFYAGADASVGGGMSVLGAGQGASSTASREMLQRDGDEAACVRSTGTDSAPPDGCGALIRVEVLPLSALAQPAPIASTPVVHCARGHHVENGECVDDAPVASTPWQSTRTTPSPTPRRPYEATRQPTNSPAHTVFAWTTVGALSVSAVTGLVALTNASAVTDPNKNLCNKDKGYCSEEGMAKKDAATTWGWVSTISLGVGLVSGVLFYVVPRPTTAVEVGLTPLPGGATLGAQGRF